MAAPVRPMAERQRWPARRSAEDGRRRARRTSWRREVRAESRSGRAPARGSAPSPALSLLASSGRPVSGNRYERQSRIGVSYRTAVVLRAWRRSSASLGPTSTSRRRPGRARPPSPWAACGPNRGAGPGQQRVPVRARAPTGVLSTSSDVLEALGERLARAGAVVRDHGCPRSVCESAPAIPWPNIPPVVLDVAELRLGLHRFARPGVRVATLGRPGRRTGRRHLTMADRGAIDPRAVVRRDSGYGRVRRPSSSRARRLSPWRVSDMWSMSTTMPSRIASRSASSPAIVRPVLFRSPCAVRPRPEAWSARSIPSFWASGPTFFQSTDSIVTGVADLLVLPARPWSPGRKPSSTSGRRRVRCHELTMNITS